MDFRQVYDENFDFVWRTLRRLGVRDPDTADAAQEVFVIVHRKLAEFAGDAKITTWLYTICMRVARDRRRAAHARYEKTDAAPLDERADSSVDLGARVAREEGLALLERVLDALPLEQRAVFTLCELDELSMQEAAEMLDVPVGTVASRLRRARATFRDEVTRLHARQDFAVSLLRRRVAQ